jgi:hypothetical protein
LKAIAVLLGLVLLARAAPAQGEGEPEDYRIVREAREACRAAPTEERLDAFAKAVAGYLEANPKGERRPVVQLWWGDALAERDPRGAYRAYVAAATPEARERAGAIAFRFEAPPAMRVDRWVGTPVDPREVTGEVTVLAFFSMTHPQTKKLLPTLDELHAALGPKGLRMVGVAAVVDDHKNQLPEALEERLRKCPRPFPVAVDFPMPGAPSETLRAYRGRFLPWMVAFDRYGRIAWLDGIHPQANSFANAEKRLRELLAAPTLEELAAGVRGGDAAALEALAAIRTKEAAAALLASLDGSPLAERGLAAVRGLLPEGFPSALAEARARFDRERDTLRYDFATDRLVSR